MLQCLNIWPYKDLILHKAWAEFRSESERRYLGLVWWMLDPLIQMAIYYFVFGILLQRGGPGFIPLLLCGLTCWRWFDSGVKNGSRSILRHKGFVQRVAFHKIVFPVSMLLTSMMKFAFSLMVLFILLGISGVPFQPYFFLLPVVLAVELLLIFGLSLPLAAFVPFVPDVYSLVEYALRLMFFMSAIFYRIDDQPEKLQLILRLNPMCIVIESSRDVLLHARMPDWGRLGAVAALGVLGIYAGAYMTWRFDSYYAKRMVQ